MDVVELWGLQGMMFLLMAAGAVLTRTGVLNDAARGALTDLVLDFLMPCNIILSFVVDIDMETLKSFALLLAVALLAQLLSYVLSKILYTRQPEEISRVMRYCTIVSNSGFIGMAVAEGIFGAEGLMYASIFIIPMRVMIYSAGISCFTGSVSIKDTVRQVAVHPCMVAVYIGFVYMFLHQPVQQVYASAAAVLPAALTTLIAVGTTAVGSMVSAAGGCTTGLTMILIGMMLTDIRLRDLIDRNTVFITVLRLFLLPLAVYIGCSLIGMDPLLKGVSVILTAMPAGSTAPIFAAKYGCDYSFASRCVVVTTVLSMLSIPLWCMVL